MAVLIRKVHVDGGDGDGGNWDLGHVGGAPPWWGCAPVRDPRLEPRRLGTPSPNRLSVLFHPGGKKQILLERI